MNRLRVLPPPRARQRPARARAQRQPPQARPEPQLSLGAPAASEPQRAAAGAGSLAGDETLVHDRLQLNRDPGDQRVEAASQAGDRRGDGPDELGVQHLARGQTGDRAHVIGAEHRAVEQAALELEQVQRTSGVVERLGGHRGVAVDQRQRGRADEHRLEVRGARLVGGALGQRVLDHAEAGIGIAQLGPQLGDLGHRDAAVVDCEDRLGGADLLGDLVDDDGFLVSVHVRLLALSHEKRPQPGRASSTV